MIYELRHREITLQRRMDEFHLRAYIRVNTMSSAEQNKTSAALTRDQIINALLPARSHSDQNPIPH